MSCGVSPDVSSMYKGASDKSFNTDTTLPQSSWLNWPLRIRPESTPATEANTRATSWLLDISKEKKATFFLERMATFWAIFKVNAVLPIDGRAATKIRSDFCKPLVRVSKSRNPVETPVKIPLCCCSSLMRLTVSYTTSFMAEKEDSLLVAPLISNTSCSALLTISSVSSSSR